MSWWYRSLVRPTLFSQEAEEAHNLTLERLAWASEHSLGCDLLASFFSASALPVKIWGLRFPNPVGLAAGMDKFAVALPAWPTLGFGFCELGGVTRHPQEGNPPPRMFRIPEDEAIINRMGFNNPGAQAMAERLAQWRAAGKWPGIPVGINLGKSKVTPLFQAASEYHQIFRVLKDHADFFVVNVSSPNTPNLRNLQDKPALDEIFGALAEVNAPSAAPKPILVKVAPDLTFSALDDLLEVAVSRRLSGIVATNTTISRPAASSAPALYAEGGGLSGAPLRSLSTQIIHHLYKSSAGAIPIIGSGGIFNADDAWEKIAAGASLLQVYTGLVYEGPALAKSIVAGLKQKLADHQLTDLSQAVGLAHRQAYPASSAQ